MRDRQNNQSKSSLTLSDLKDQIDQFYNEKTCGLRFIQYTSATYELYVLPESTIIRLTSDYLGDDTIITAGHDFPLRLKYHVEEADWWIGGYALNEWSLGHEYGGVGYALTIEFPVPRTGYRCEF